MCRKIAFYGVRAEILLTRNQGQGSLFLVYRGETSLEKTPYFQRIYKKLSQFYKKKTQDWCQIKKNNALLECLSACIHIIRCI